MKDLSKAMKKHGYTAGPIQHYSIKLSDGKLELTKIDAPIPGSDLVQIVQVANDYFTVESAPYRTIKWYPPES